jgi:hypothetical protein
LKPRDRIHDLARILLSLPLLGCSCAAKICENNPLTTFEEAIELPQIDVVPYPGENMKRMQGLLNSVIVCGVALAMVSSLAAETTSQVPAKVVRIKGAARYKVGSGAWQTLKRGDKLNAGTIVETGVDSRIDLMLDEGTPPTARPVTGEMLTYRATAEQNMVRVWENSRLGIDKLTRTETGADVVTETQLDLQAGHIFGSVKKMSAASKYEVKIPSGVAGIRGTTYDISVEGLIKVLVGSIYLAYVDAGGNAKTQVVMGLQQFDVRTGVLSPLSDIDKTSMSQVRIISPIQTVYTVDSTIDFVSPH